MVLSFNDRPMIENELEYLKELVASHPALLHASRLYNSYNDLSEKNVLSSSEENKLNKIAEILPFYTQYIKTQLEIKGYDDSDIKRRVKLLNDYFKKYVDEIQVPNQGTDKLKSTILEEFMYLLFADYVECLKSRLNGESGKFIDCGSTNAYTNMFFTAKDFNSFAESPNACIITKAQDFAIYRKVQLKLDDSIIKSKGTNNKVMDHVYIPILVIENKTFVEKTMMDGIIASAEKVKSGSPHTCYFLVTETYAVAQDVDISYSDIDNVFILRNSRKRETTNPIMEETVLSLFHTAKNMIEMPWFDVDENVTKHGVLYPHKVIKRN